MDTDLMSPACPKISCWEWIAQARSNCSNALVVLTSISSEVTSESRLVTRTLLLVWNTRGSTVN